jgi:hypothetical protein
MAYANHSLQNMLYEVIEKTVLIKEELKKLSIYPEEEAFKTIGNTILYHAKYTNEVYVDITQDTVDKYGFSNKYELWFSTNTGLGDNNKIRVCSGNLLVIRIHLLPGLIKMLREQ